MKKNILLVTSDEDLQLYFKNAVLGYDIELQFSTNYAEALKRIKTEEFDYIITDLFLPTNNDEESCDSYLVELNTLENNMRLPSPIKDYLIRFYTYVKKMANMKYFLLGSRLASECRIMMKNSLLLVNILDDQNDPIEFKEYLDEVSNYFVLNGLHTFYCSDGILGDSADYLIWSLQQQMEYLESVNWIKSPSLLKDLLSNS